MGGDGHLMVWLTEEAGSEDEFAQDMSDQCLSVRMRMDERARLISELEFLAVGEGSGRYLEILCRKQERDGRKLQLLRELLRYARDETHEMQLAVDDANHS